jgi:putative salt-induced outer membrane protein YdiY
MNPAFVFLTALIPTQPAPVESTPLELTTPTTFVAPAEDATVQGPPKWTGSVNIGASYSDGNTDSRAINLAADAERRSEADRWTAKGYWNYSEQRDPNSGDYVISQRRAGASLKYDFFMTKEFYLNAIGGIETDTLADISLRDYVGGGAGYQWREDSNVKWGSEAGLTYFNTDYKVSEDKEYLAARLANNLAWKINENTALENYLEAFPSLENASDFYGKSDTKVKTNLSKTMFAQLQWVYQYTSTPADNKERADNLLVLGVGWSF